LAGRYGSDACEVASQLLARGWVDLLSSDFHARAPLEIHLSEAFFTTHDGLKKFRLLMVGNPGRVISDELPLPGSSLRMREGMWN
jgi:hypothetical protein